MAQAQTQATPTGVARLPAHVARQARLLRHTAYGQALANVPNVPCAVTQALVVAGLANGTMACWQAANLWLHARTYGQP